MGSPWEGKLDESGSNSRMSVVSEYLMWCRDSMWWLMLMQWVLWSSSRWLVDPGSVVFSDVYFQRRILQYHQHSYQFIPIAINIICICTSTLLAIMSKVSSWIQRQKKADLIEIADSIGFTEWAVHTCATRQFYTETHLNYLFSYEGLLKVELDVALQDYLEENASRLSIEPRLAPFYTRRGVGSPIKRESSSVLDNGESTAIKRSAGRPLRRIVRSATEETSNAIESASS